MGFTETPIWFLSNMWLYDARHGSVLVVREETQLWVSFCHLWKAKKWLLKTYQNLSNSSKDGLVKSRVVSKKRTHAITFPRRTIQQGKQSKGIAWRQMEVGIGREEPCSPKQRLKTKLVCPGTNRYQIWICNIPMCTLEWKKVKREIGLASWRAKDSTTKLTHTN